MLQSSLGCRLLLAPLSSSRLQLTLKGLYVCFGLRAQLRQLLGLGCAPLSHRTGRGDARKGQNGRKVTIGRLRPLDL